MPVVPKPRSATQSAAAKQNKPRIRAATWTERMRDRLNEVELPLAGSLGDLLASLLPNESAEDTMTGLTAPLGIVVKPVAGSLGELVSRGKRIPNPIKAYHGSPHDFEQFSLSKIGTGEGAQAYGHGLYFAENPSVAAGYKQAGVVDPRDSIGNAIKGAYHIAGPEKLTLDVMRDWMVREGVKREHITPDILDAALEAARGQSADGTVSSGALKAYQRLGRLLGELPKGKTYEVNIHASPDELLDWDKPLSQQREEVRLLARDAGFTEITDGPFKGRWKDDYSTVIEAPTGRHLYESLSRQARDIGVRTNRTLQTTLPGSQAKATEDLLGMNIKGIQYLDQGSRAAGTGTKNFVIFDDELIEIAKKYGIPLAAAGSWVAQQGGTVVPRQQ